MDPVFPPRPGLAAPLAVTYASYAMRAGAVLQAVAAATALLTGSLMRAAFFGILSLIAIVFWPWCARAARRAEPGTRGSAIILFAWLTIDVVKWRSGWESPPVMICLALVWLAGLGATALLFGKGSACYFRQYRADGRVRRWVRASLAKTARSKPPG